MPVISMFYGIIVRMFFMDNKEHKLPHIHVEYADDSAVIAIPDGFVLAGSLPKSKLKLVEAWVEIHKDELMADWTLAIKGEQLFKIEALNYMTHKISTLELQDNYQLLLEFDNGTKKLFSMLPYLDAPVFRILKDEAIFRQVKNQNSFIEWQPYEIDLSADTLWHDGVKFQ